MSSFHPESITINGRDYRWPAEPVVVVCVDGCQPEYLTQAIAQGRMPFISRLTSAGLWFTALGVLPSYTNPNNLSIITGVAPAGHGISGNFFYDAEREAEVMMNDPAYLRADTIPAAFARAGARVAIVTAKDKLRRLLGAGLDFRSGRAVVFSAERSDQCSQEEHGIAQVNDWIGLPVPDVYSAALSEFVLAAGCKLLEQQRPDLTYLSTTDYVQHKHAPDHPQAWDFYARLDRQLARLDQLGARLVITADHGMLPKATRNGEPSVIYLQELLDQWLPGGQARALLPITDPYVVHHGSLGSFATIYLQPGVDRAALQQRLQALPSLARVLTRAEAGAELELPTDRIGDLVLLSRDDCTIGTSPKRHDLSGLTEPLRSHGGLGEQVVPLLVNRRLLGSVDRLRNFDAFDLALNRLSDQRPVTIEGSGQPC